ncbi:hypothetical protein Glove_417g24 [Diversispora epigaea]|uniref:Uncharacterized protein n=1 Tax=Diversispora epigaea TaxID=1348612 RepID=A0A397GW85_9GLOM|nr:hypothetical protein Glove_417g24 [Diversispora epigaea]
MRRINGAINKFRTDKYVSTKQTNDNSMLDSVSGCKQAYKNEELLSTSPKKAFLDLKEYCKILEQLKYRHLDEESQQYNIGWAQDLKEYCKILEQLKYRHLDEESQREKHLCKLLI